MCLKAFNFGAKTESPVSANSCVARRVWPSRIIVVLLVEQNEGCYQNGEWGMGNGEWEMGNGEWGMGNGKLKWEIENRKSNIFLH